MDAVLRSLDLRSANRLELLRSLPAPLGDWRSEALTLSLSPTGRPPPMRLGAGTSPAPERSPTLPDDACTLPAVSLRRRQARLEARGARAEPGSRSERKSWPISLGRLGRDRRVGVAGAILLLVVSMAGIESGRDRLHGWWAQLETAVSGSGGTSPGAGDAIPALEIARLAAQDDPDLASLVGEAVRAPGRWQPFYELGQALRLRGDLPAAIHMYREASRLSPGDPASAFALGYVLQLQGEYAAASEQYQAAIRLDPNHAPAFYNLGMLFQRVGEWGEALEHYRRAAALSLSGGPGPDTRRRVAENSQRPPAPQGR